MREGLPPALAKVVCMSADYFTTLTPTFVFSYNPHYIPYLLDGQSINPQKFILFI